jgi:hypothetical protein
MGSQAIKTGKSINIVKKRTAGSFEGISLAAYKRLLPSALMRVQETGISSEAGISKLCSAGVPPHLAKVYELWTKQRARAMEELFRIRDAEGQELARKHAVFSFVKKSVGETTLETMMRVTASGEIRLDHDYAGELNSEQESCCGTIYALYSLALASTREVRKLLSRILASKINGGNCGKTYTVAVSKSKKGKIGHSTPGVRAKIGKRKKQLVPA